MAIMMMMMRLRCTEKLQLIASADPTPLPSSPTGSSLTYLPFAHPLDLPFNALMGYTSETLIQLCCDMAFHQFDLLIHCECDESDSIHSRVFTQCQQVSWKMLRESLDYR